jgi:surface antigen
MYTFGLFYTIICRDITMKNILVLVSISVLVFGLSGCGNMNKQDTGVIAGGAIGGLLGSQFGGGNGRVLAAVGGAIIGAALGGVVGHSMDKQDQQDTQRALESTPTGRTTSWSNPDTGNAYRVTPTRTYRQHGQNCRNYTMLATIDGKARKIHGRACRKNGHWVEQRR